MSLSTVLKTNPIISAGLGLFGGYVGASISCALLTSNPEYRHKYLMNALIFSTVFTGSAVISCGLRMTYEKHKAALQKLSLFSSTPTVNQANKTNHSEMAMRPKTF